jgi:YD repeat-containing protein
MKRLSVKEIAIITASVFIFLSIFLRSPNAFADTITWTKKADMPMPIDGPPASVDGKIFVFGGWESDLVYEYDPYCDLWTQRASMPSARGGTVALYSNGKVYVAGGNPVPDGSLDLDVYDPQSDVWHSKSPMPSPSWGGWGVAGGVVSNRLYVIGGYNWPNHEEDFCREYDISTDSWALKSSMPQAVEWTNAAVYNNKIYVVAGDYGTGAITLLNDIQVYDPFLDTWEIISGLPAYLCSAGVVVYDHKLYIFGGITAAPPFPKWRDDMQNNLTVYSYDLSTGTFGNEGEMPSSDTKQVCLINDKVYLIGAGEDGNETWEGIFNGNNPDPPTLISPINYSTLTSSSLTFEWSSIPDAECYEILVDNNAGFGSAEINETGLTETTITKINHLPDNVYSWKVRAKFSHGSYTAWSDTWQFTYQLPVYTEPYWVPLYRLYKGGDIHDHYYTTIPAHRDDYVKNNGYTYERIECYISDRKFNDTNCGYLFHLWDKTNDIHFYTGSESEKDAKIIEGFSYEGIVGFIYTQPFDWGVSLYRLFNATNSDYFLTVSEFERDYAIDNYGFSADYTTVGYVSPIGILNPNSRLKFNAFAGYGAKVGNGNYRYSHIDLRIPGIGMPFVFSRTYNSLNCGTDGPLGHGWTHSFQARLIDDGTRVFVFWPDGHADYTITRKDQTQYIFKIAESSFDPLSPKAPFDVAQFDSIVDKNEKSILLTYDLDTGNLTTITDTANRAATFTYYSDLEGHLGHIKTITDPAGRTLTFTYDSIDNLTKVIDARGNATTFEYDPDGLHLLTKVTLPGGQAITNTYEDFKVKSQTVDGKTFDFGYTPTLATVTAPNTTTTQYDLSTNQVNSITDPLGYSASLAFDGPNPTRPETINDKNDKNTTFTYNDGSGDTGKTILNKGNVLTAMNTLGQTTCFTYDEKNNLLTSKDALNNETTYEYDVNKRNLVKITYPEGGIQRFTYTSNGQVETATDPNGHTTTYTYDSDGNVTRITDNLSNHVDFTYDGVGRMLRRTDQSGRVTTYVNDNNDNLTQVTDANSKTTTYTYDNNDNLSKITNAKGKATTHTYNNMNLFATETDPLSKVYQYGY